MPQNPMLMLKAPTSLGTRTTPSPGMSGRRTTAWHGSALMALDAGLPCLMGSCLIFLAPRPALTASFWILGRFWLVSGSCCWTYLFLKLLLPWVEKSSLRESLYSSLFCAAPADTQGKPTAPKLKPQSLNPAVTLPNLRFLQVPIINPTVEFVGTLLSSGRLT